MWFLAALAGTEGTPQHEQAFVGGHRWVLQDRVLTRDDVPVLDGVVGPVAHAGDRVLAAWLEEEPVHTGLVVIDGGERPRIVDVPGDPTRVALSADGRWAAWVSGHTGWASVYVSALDVVAPRQLTNVQVERRKGGPPAGFTPPPQEGMRFDGDVLVWTAAGEEVRVRWR